MDTQARRQRLPRRPENPSLNIIRQVRVFFSINVVTLLFKDILSDIRTHSKKSPEHPIVVTHPYACEHSSQQSQIMIITMCRKEPQRVKHGRPPSAERVN